MNSLKMKAHVLFVTAALLSVASPGLAQKGVSLRGIVDIVGGADDDVRFLNTTNTTDSNFDALRARLFVEAARENTQIYIQFLFSQESRDQDRLYGAYVLHRLVESWDLHLEAGIIPVHDGIWAPYTYSNKNPLVGIPMAYYWKTTLTSRMMPVDINQLVAAKGGGQGGVFYADSTGARGVAWSSNPILYDNCWNFGVYALGAKGNFEYQVGVTRGAPASPVTSSDSNEDISLHAKVGYAFTPGLKLYLSAARGAYLQRDVAPYMPAGKTVNDYYQDVLVASVDWRWNHLWFMGEYFYNRFDTPLRTDGLAVTSAWAQGVYSFLPGWDVAVRYDELRFEEVETSTGTTSWDQNIHRVETGIGYHVSRDLLLKGVVQASDMGDGFTSEHVIPAVQMSFSF